MSDQATGAEVESFEITVQEPVVMELRERLEGALWPEQPEEGWELGTDLGYARELCAHWASEYEFSRLNRLNDLGSARWRGLHFLRAGEGDGLPVVLLHGWPSGPVEYERAARLLVDAGREVVVPSLPGYAWSDDPGEPLNVAGMAARLRALLEDGLGLERYAIAGGDWGGIIGARMAFDAPERVAGLYVSTPGALPRPADLTDPPMSEAEAAYAERALRWLRAAGHHMIIQSSAPDAISPALTDSPAGLATYLVEKYRRWSDSSGDVELRFSKDDLCDFLTMFWSTGSIASSMRLYFGERSNRWRLAAGDTIDVPAGIGAFRAGMKEDVAGRPVPMMIGNPPREWSERVLSDLRSWKELPSGGHFAAFEEPNRYTSDLLVFLEGIE